MPQPQPRGSIATNRPYPCRGLDLCLTGCEGYVLDATAMIEHVVLVALFLGGAPNDRLAFKMSTMAKCTEHAEMWKARFADAKVGCRVV